jgi:hypothetical protein
MGDGWPTIHPLQRRRQQRLWKIGICVLAVGVAAARLTYRIEMRDAGPTVEQLMPGTTAALQRQRGILYGQTGATLLAWVDYLEQPEGHAALIVSGSVLTAVICFVLASRIEPDH